VQLVIPAAQVLITRASLPPGAKRRDGALLAFAVEEASAAEPDANEVSWLGGDAFAVLDRKGIAHWRSALQALGVRAPEVHPETLLLPLANGEWSLAWRGGEGFVRSGEFEGAATDSGDPATPPLALRMMLDQAARPAAIALYMDASAPAPDLKRWQAELGVPLRPMEAWDWRNAPSQAGVALAQQRARWRVNAAALAALRPAAWLAGAALAVHSAALIVDWAKLGSEQRSLRAQMEARFRTTFPDAVAVADPALQMRRQLAAARHRAGVPDSGDFAPMMQKVGGALKELSGVRAISYESGRMTLELAVSDQPALRRAAARLAQTGLIVDVTGGKLITVRSP
jgi:general secretion pathway protein L